MGWHVKQRIIAKAVRSASFGQNTPFPGTLTDQRHRISRMSQIDNDALKSGRAFCFFNMLKGFQEFCIVCFISPIADDSGISGRVDSGSPFSASTSIPESSAILGSPVTRRHALP